MLNFVNCIRFFIIVHSLLSFYLFLPIQESHDEQNLFLPLITQSHRLLLAISRMAFGKTTEYFIDTYIPGHLQKRVDSIAQ